MNLYEFEGKSLFEKYSIFRPKGSVVYRNDDYGAVYQALGCAEVVVKAQVLSGKRGKNNGIKFCASREEVVGACEELFAMNIRGQYVAAVLIEEKLNIVEEHYVSITYDTNKKTPVLMYSPTGGMDIEEVPPREVAKFWLDSKAEAGNFLPIIDAELEGGFSIDETVVPLRFLWQENQHVPFIKEVWDLFLAEDLRVIEINPLVKTEEGKWYAADAKIALDDDAFYRHDEWKTLAPRTMMGRLPTEREINVKKIDEGEKYYQGTAGKYIEMDGDIALILNGGGASIANMDVLQAVGLSAANYTEYSGNPPREKVRELAKIVLSKPGIRGLWMCGVVSNFTNVKETFLGIIDALDELKPTYPIVVRRDGPEGEEGRRLLAECATRNNLQMKIFSKDMSMGDTAKVLAEMVKI